MHRGHRARRRMSRIGACAMLAGVAAASAHGAPLSASPATSISPTGQYANGTVLPNGRRLTPMGTTLDLGDLPLGLAISPDARLAVAIDSGQGYGLHHGKESYCTPDVVTVPYCPYFAPGTVGYTTSGDPNTAAPDEGLSVVELASGRITRSDAVTTSHDHTQLDKPGTFNFFYVGVAFSPDGRHLFAAGGGNDAVYDFPVRGGQVASRPARTLTLPHQQITAAICNVPVVCSIPSVGSTAGYTRQLAVSPDGATLAVSHQYNNTVDLVDTASFDGAHVTQVHLLSSPLPYPTGFYLPGALVFSPDGATLYVAGEGVGLVTAISMTQPQILQRTIPAGDHPSALAISPDGSQLYIANANDDTLQIADTGTGMVSRTLTLHALPGEALGSIPDALAVSPDAQRLYVALAGDNAVAVLGTKESFQGSGSSGAGEGGATPPPGPPAVTGERGLPNTAAPAPPPAAQWVLGGLLPTGWYPSALATSADGGTLFVVDAKGLGSRNLGTPRRGDVITSYEYVGHNNPGLLQVVTPPTGQALDTASRTVQENLLAAAAADSIRDPSNPIPAATGGSSPITHVIEVVRKNRTFDQELGDLPADQGRPSVIDPQNPAYIDARPAYTLFGRDVTPNAHALLGDVTPCAASSASCPQAAAQPAFAGSDNFYSDGEVSVQGHWWTTSAAATDYVERGWPQYYSPRGHIDDSIGVASAPHNCSIFQAAIAMLGAQQTRVYGEANGIVNPSVGALIGATTGALSGAVPAGVVNPCQAIPDAAIDLQHFTDQVSFDFDARTQAADFLADTGINADGSTSADPSKYLRAFSYLTLPTDHTGGLQWANTPRSRVSQNDAALGALVSAVSRSKYWASTAIFVMEDDAQDGLDHEDGHRNLLYVISPWARHTGPDGKPGYIGHRHYSQASVLKTIELVLGLPHLSAYDQNAGALYDLFQSTAQLTRADLGPFNVEPGPRFIDESSQCYSSDAAKRAAASGCVGSSVSPALAADLMQRSTRLDLSAIDRAGPELEVIDWQLGHPDLPVPLQLQAEVMHWQASRSEKEN